MGTCPALLTSWLSSVLVCKLLHEKGERTMPGPVGVSGEQGGRPIPKAPAAGSEQLQPLPGFLPS